MFLIMIGAFGVGLDGRVREVSSDNTEEGAGDVERIGLKRWYFENSGCVKKVKRLSEM